MAVGLAYSALLYDDEGLARGDSLLVTGTPEGLGLFGRQLEGPA